MIPNRIARLDSTGATDISFNPGAGLDAEGICVNLDSSGQVIAGGVFDMVSGSVQPKLALFEADGTLIPSTPTPSATVRTLVTQAGGEIILGGDFTSVDGTTRNRIARLLPDRSLEAGFNPNASTPVYALALQTDGKIMAGGTFTTPIGSARNYVARLYNGDFTDRVYANSAALIEWDRTGANEETQKVEFEIDTGSGYGPLAGVVSRSATGWQIIPSTPLSGATNNVRATAFPSDSHSSGTHQTIASIPVLPEIQVLIDNKLMEDGVSTVSFPTLQVGSKATAKVTIYNAGLDTLKLTSNVTISGQWELESQPFTSPFTAIASQTSVSFDISFAPDSEGPKTGLLSIISDDADEGTFTVNLSGEATVGPGGLDLTWQPNANRPVRAIAKSSNSNVWLGGDFTALGTIARARLALVKKDTVPISPVVGLQAQAANIIPAGTSQVATAIKCIAQLPDGTALIGGQFPTKKLYWVGFSPTGDVILKAAFDIAVNPAYPSIPPVVRFLAVQADGKVVVGGFFGGVRIGNSAFIQTGTLFRLIFSPTGLVSVDTSFSKESADREVYGAAIQTDGKIVLCRGPGSAPSERSEVIRIAANGEKDATFSSLARGMLGLALDSQGRVIVQGSYSSIGTAPASGVSRLSSSGALDATFALVPSAATALLPMVDGKLVVASEAFGALASVSRLEKFLADGTADTSFISTITGSVLTVCSQEDGALLIGGLFGTAPGTLTSARIVNSTVSTALTVVNSTTVQWLRSGALPETQVVVFDVSQDNGATWIRFGQGQRIAGGWQLTGINLPFSGILRARAYIQSAGNSSIMENQTSFSGLNVPDLIIQTQGANGPEVVADNGIATTVTAGAGSLLPVVVTLVNTGSAAMTNVVATVTAASTTSANPKPLPGAERWTIGADPNSTIVAGGTATMIMNFNPAFADRGLLYADLSIASSVPGLKNPYRITLVGASVTLPVATTGGVTRLAGGDVILNGSFTPNDINAKAYFRYGLESTPEANWTSTSVTTLSGFGTAQSLDKPVSDLLVGATYAVRAFIVNSSNVTFPASGNRVRFVPTNLAPP